MLSDPIANVVGCPIHGAYLGRRCPICELAEETDVATAWPPLSAPWPSSDPHLSTSDNASAFLPRPLALPLELGDRLREIAP